MFAGDIQIAASVNETPGMLATAWTEGFAAVDGTGRPYLVSLGNHDYDYGAIRYTPSFDQSIGYDRISARPWYVGCWNAPGVPNNSPLLPNEPVVPAGGVPSKCNQAIRVEAGNRQLLVIALEVWPRQGALDWAGGLINANPACDVIVLNHAYMTNTGTLMDDTNGGPTDPWFPGFTTAAQVLAWAQGFANMHLVLCGHFVPDDIESGTPNGAHRVDHATDGHPLLGIYADYQYAVPPAVDTSQVALMLELSETTLNVRAFNTSTNEEVISAIYPALLPWT